MVFINPKTDFAFKKIFGSEQSKDILISFLNAMLYREQPIIEDLVILNPYLAPKIRGVKDTYLDVKAKISGDQTVIIEMQVLNVEGFEKRILYNAAKAYSIQLGIGEDYTLLNPVIALTITDFVMFPQLEQMTSRFVLKEKDYLIDYLTHDIELVFVELPKFNKDLTELQTVTDKWIYFLRSARKLSSIPDVMASVPEIKHAFTVAHEANLTADELEDQDKREIYIQDQRGVVTRATRIGMEQGMAVGLKQGLQQGIEQGLEQGLEQGRQEGKQKLTELIVRQLEKRVGKLSPDHLALICTLSLAQMELLGEAILDFRSTEDLAGWLQNF